MRPGSHRTARLIAYYQRPDEIRLLEVAAGRTGLLARSALLLRCAGVPVVRLVAG